MLCCFQLLLYSVMGRQQSFVMSAHQAVGQKVFHTSLALENSPCLSHFVPDLLGEVKTAEGKHWALPSTCYTLDNVDYIHCPCGLQAMGPFTFTISLCNKGSLIINLFQISGPCLKKLCLSHYFQLLGIIFSPQLKPPYNNVFCLVAKQHVIVY